MQIDYIVCPDVIEEIIAKKHHVNLREARQALLNSPRIRFAEKSHIEGEDDTPHLARPLADGILLFSSFTNQPTTLRSSSAYAT